MENLGSNMGQKSVLNQLFNPFRALGSVRNGFAIYFSCRLSPSKLRTASKWSQNQSFPLNRSGMIKEKHPVVADACSSSSSYSVAVVVVVVVVIVVVAVVAVVVAVLVVLGVSL